MKSAMRGATLSYIICDCFIKVVPGDELELTKKIRKELGCRCVTKKLDEVFNLSNIIFKIMFTGSNHKLANLCLDACCENIGVGESYSCEAYPECCAITMECGIITKALGDFLSNIDLNPFSEDLKK